MSKIESSGFFITGLTLIAASLLPRKPRPDLVFDAYRKVINTAIGPRGNVVVCEACKRWGYSPECEHING